MGVQLLIVDDDESIRDVVGTALRYAGFDVQSAVDGLDALAQAAEHTFDLIVLDVLMPGIDGYEVCRRLRAGGDNTPVIFLTAKVASRDVLEGFQRGGDDYLTKPFVLDELVARINAVLRRVGQIADEGPLRCGDLELDETRHEVRRAGQLIELSPTSFSLLRYLMLNADRVVSKQQILDRVWQDEFGGNGHIVETYISNLRRRLELPGSPPLIRTLRGVGYTLRGTEK
jgi:two-component system, OmpR family, response regulator